MKEQIPADLVAAGCHWLSTSLAHDDFSISTRMYPLPADAGEQEDCFSLARRWLAGAPNLRQPLPALMRETVKVAWVQALRCGEYTQCRGGLRNGSEHSALGVLCDLHAKETGDTWDRNVYLGADAWLPLEVQRWAGLIHRDPRLNGFTVGERTESQLWTFKKIAQEIEMYL